MSTDNWHECVNMNVMSVRNMYSHGWPGSMPMDGLADIRSCNWGRTEMQQLLPDKLQLGGELPPSSSHTRSPPPGYNISPFCLKVKESRSREGNMESALSVKD